MERTLKHAARKWENRDKWIDTLFIPVGNSRMGNNPATLEVWGKCASVEQWFLNWFLKPGSMPQNKTLTWTCQEANK